MACGSGNVHLPSLQVIGSLLRSGGQFAQVKERLESYPALSIAQTRDAPCYVCFGAAMYAPTRAQQVVHDLIANRTSRIPGLGGIAVFHTTDRRMSGDERYGLSGRRLRVVAPSLKQPCSHAAMQQCGLIPGSLPTP